jgi:transcriptional regulator with XRE-family HTH domain
MSVGLAACDSQSPPGYQEIDVRRGERITRAMLQRGFRYNCQLCYDIGVSESTLSRWRSGRPLSLNHAILLSEGLGVTLDYLLTGAENAVEGDTFGAEVNELQDVFRRLDETNRGLALKLLRALSNRSLPGEISSPFPLDEPRSPLPLEIGDLSRLAQAAPHLAMRRPEEAAPRMMMSAPGAD